MNFPNGPRKRRLPLAFLPYLLLLAVALVARGEVVINEIMYRPGTTTPVFTVENVGREFIELHNTGAAAVDISGWALTNGVNYTFPAATTIPAGGFVVIANDPAAVQALYGISGVFGPWGAGGTLANSGEKITLSQPGVTPGTFTSVDSVTYASEGDWALRVRETTFNGWDWSSAANTGGKSLELRNPAISNDNGQNWASSTAAAGATPGGANSVLVNNLPPVIHGVKHSPAVPKSTESVTISCDVTDEAAPQFLAATLFWRIATATSPGAFQSLAMTGDGSGKFSAVLGPQAHLAIVEFYVSVNDGVGTRTWPAPTSEGQNANCVYQVTNEALSTTDAYYFLILTGAENAAYVTTAASDSQTTKIDRQFNTTLVVSNGAETVIRYRSQIRFRGNSSRGYQFKPLRVSIPNDDPWDGGTGFNLNPKASHLQFMGMRMMQAAGVRAPDSIPVKPRRNGVEYTTSSGTTPDFGKWVREEDIDGDLVNNHWGDFTSGGIYKKVDGSGPLDYYWRSGQAAPANPNTMLDGWSKQNGGSANDWSDLTSFFTVWQTAAKPHFPASSTTDVAGSNGTRIAGIGNWNGTAFSAAEITSVETVSDLDQWARWFAVMTILQDLETDISNGVDDDYSAYFVPAAGGQRRMQLIVHDLDTIFGLGDNAQAYSYTGLYDMTEGGQSGYTFRTLLPLFGTVALAGNAAFRTKYSAALRDLYGTVFNADTAGNPNPPFYQFVDSHLTGWAPAGTISAIKTFATNRQAYLLGLVGAAATTPAAATSTATVTSTPGSLMIHEVLAYNVAAHANGGGFPDVIELHNSGGAPIDLTGKSLTDDALVKAKYVFPAGTTIAAGGYLIVYADSDLAAPGLHAGFSLDAQGDGVFLFDTVAGGQAQLDSVVFGLQAADFSIGRTGGALDTWALCTPSIGAANTAVPVLAAPGGLRINEWAGNSDYLLSDDFLELHNPAAQPVAIAGMTLTDDFINYPLEYALRPLSFIAPGAFVRFDAKGKSASDGNVTELPFSISAAVGWLALIGQNGTIVDRVDVVAQPSDTSRGRTPDGGATIATYGLPGNVPTPGASNVNPPAGVLALLNGLRISELQHKPSNLEFIELHNIGATTLDLAGVRFVKGVDYTFPAGVTLAAGAYIVVCRDVAAFQAQYGAGVPLAPGAFVGSLDNAGENITLRPPAPWDVNILNFAYNPDWYTEVSTANYSLTVRNDTATPARDWDEKSTWSPSPALLGNPGTDSPPTITSALTAAGDTAAPFSYQIVATKSPTAYGASPLPGGLSVNPATGLISGTPTQAGTFSITLSATNAGGTGTRTLVLTVVAAPPPTITSTGTASGVVGTAFTYQIVATNTPTSYDATPLPAGLSINPATGLISGTPTGAGTSTITLSATNSTGPGTKTLTLTVASQPIPVVTSAGTASGVVGDAFSYQIIATNTPASYDATGLPGGLTVNTASGLISGTPTGAGTFNVTVSATNPGGTGTRALTLTVATSGPLAAFVWSTIATPQQAGVPFAATLTAKDAQGRTVTSFNGSANLTAAVTGAGAPVTIGTGTSTWNWPLSTFYHDARTQVIYLASEVGAASRITGLALDVTTIPAQLLNVWTIRMKHTALAAYASNAWESTGWTTVYQANTTISATGLVNFVFTTPFDFNGTSNLMVDFCFNNTSYTSDGQVRYTTTAGNRSLYYRTDSGYGNPLTWTGTGSPTPSAIARIPNVRLTFDQTAVSVSPAVAAGFVNGVWSGNITVMQVANTIALKADDGAAHIATSGTFNTVAPPVPVITSPTSATAVVGQPFSYQILATNYVASYNATSLPAGLGVSTATGLVSGTPTAAGTSSVGLSAINFSGTGSATLSLQVQADADGDGMGDAWETANGLNPADAADAALDKDGDGQSNRAEWLAGTAADSATSRMAIMSEQIVGTDIQLLWASVAGKRYRVFHRADLIAGTWVEITPAPIVATGVTAGFTHSGGATGPACFYRVEVVP